jgi:hypothetical protein
MQGPILLDLQREVLPFAAPKHESKKYPRRDIFFVTRKMMSFCEVIFGIKGKIWQRRDQILGTIPTLGEYLC